MNVCLTETVEGGGRVGGAQVPLPTSISISSAIILIS